MNFNPRSPHGERRRKRNFDTKELLISIHAPRTGSDLFAAHLRVIVPHFNPRSPHGERPALPAIADFRFNDFNPRSPHGERHFSSCRASCKCDFNPRSPHGERHYRVRAILPYGLFQSTLPARGATCRDLHLFRTRQISIHAPRTGSDECASSLARNRNAFQSTLPARGATQ